MIGSLICLVYVVLLCSVLFWLCFASDSVGHFMLFLPVSCILVVAHYISFL
jgi:hypothetical protein